MWTVSKKWEVCQPTQKHSAILKAICMWFVDFMWAGLQPIVSTGIESTDCILAWRAFWISLLSCGAISRRMTLDDLASRARRNEVLVTRPSENRRENWRILVTRLLKRDCWMRNYMSNYSCWSRNLNFRIDQSASKFRNPVNIGQRPLECFNGIKNQLNFLNAPVIDFNYMPHFKVACCWWPDGPHSIWPNVWPHCSLFTYVQMDVQILIWRARSLAEQIIIASYCWSSKATNILLTGCSFFAWAIARFWREWEENFLQPKWCLHCGIVGQRIGWRTKEEEKRAN